MYPVTFATFYWLEASHSFCLSLGGEVKGHEYQEAGDQGWGQHFLGNQPRKKKQVHIKSSGLPEDSWDSITQKQNRQNNFLIFSLQSSGKCAALREKRVCSLPLCTWAICNQNVLQSALLLRLWDPSSSKLLCFRPTLPSLSGYLECHRSRF